MTQRGGSWSWPFRLTTALGIFGAIITLSGASTLAQIKRDATLGSEGSVIKSLDNLGIPVDQINGGAKRGANLFHSFEQFNIKEGRGVYFTNPVGVKNILSRVTGSNRSDVAGTLGVLGKANLFLINPNGIVFGPNASLDVEGSFVATTANAIGLANEDIFSANPSSPLQTQLLNVNPNALFYNQIAAKAKVNPSIVSSAELQLPQGQSLLLVGGDVSLDGGVLEAPGGRVELGGLAGSGAVRLNGAGNNLSLSFPEDIGRADVSLTNRSAVNVRAEGGGSIAINSRNLDVLGESEVGAGIASGMGSTDSQAGDIEINAIGTLNLSAESFIDNSLLNGAKGKGGNIDITTGVLQVTDGAGLSASTFGQGDAGSVKINTRDKVSFRDGLAGSIVGETGKGKGGGIDIKTKVLEVTDGAQLNTGTIGQGDAGSVKIDASDKVSFRDGAAISTVGSPGYIAKGKGGGIDIATRVLEVTDGTLLSTSTYGQGDAGSIKINARDKVFFRDGLAGSTVAKIAKGKGGGIDITTRVLEVTDGTLLSTSTYGQGDAGSIKINARDKLSFDGIGSDGFSSGALSTVEAGAIGDGGGIDIKAGSLSATEGAQLDTSTFGQGDAGSVKIDVREKVSFDGESAALSTVEPGAKGKGGGIEIKTKVLEVTDGAGLNAITFGQGNAGSVKINASDKVSFRGGLALSTIEETAKGKGGGIEIKTEVLEVTEGAQLRASTFGQGDAGSININASDKVFFRGGAAFSDVVETAKGKGGDIDIKTGVLEVTDVAILSATTYGQGDAGSIKINARNKVSFGGSFAFSTVGLPGYTAKGKGGGIEIKTEVLEVTEGAQLRASTFGQGDAGSIKISARDQVSFDGESAAFSDVDETAKGKGGNIDIKAGSLSVTDGAKLSASSEGNGPAGNIVVKAASIRLDNQSKLSSNTTAGQGNIFLNSQDLLLLRRGSTITTNATEKAAGGNIVINDPSNPRGFVIAVPSENSDIKANATEGRGGAVQINAQGVFGIKRRELESPLTSDITASSEQGPEFSGTVELNTPDIDPSQGIANLPTEPVNPEIAQECSASGSQGSNRFINSGRGGIPTNPYEPLDSRDLLAEVQPPAQWLKHSTDAIPTFPAPETSPESIVEAQGWRLNQSGDVVLVAKVPHELSQRGCRLR